MVPIAMVIGYARVSTVDQNPELQLDALRRAGCERIYTDREGGRSPRRPQLETALEVLRSGDVLVVWALDRLARSLTELIRLGTGLDRRGVELRSLKEGIDTTTAAGRFAYQIWGAMAEFEAARNSERSKAAAAAAKRNGRRWGKPRMFADPEKVRTAKALLRDGSLSKRAVARRLGCHPVTLYRWFPGGDPDAFRDPYEIPAERPAERERAA
ncbi:MAG: recombinase family protein [Bryobacterales bacterium]|nr:recombinase family protein [Bryobacterales bacterium]MDE0125844.1 recombinase family protein [Bryobacterales bacterium]